MVLCRILLPSCHRDGKIFPLLPSSEPLSAVDISLPYLFRCDRCFGLRTWNVLIPHIHVQAGKVLLGEASFHGPRLLRQSAHHRKGIHRPYHFRRNLGHRNGNLTSFYDLGIEHDSKKQTRGQFSGIVWRSVGRSILMDYILHSLTDYPRSFAACIIRAHYLRDIDHGLAFFCRLLLIPS